ncbi:MAG: 4Fe-4S binding protein [Desulfomonilia bacterium]|nr:4Fe-4S binding protein [Desulfomonilia bacterium]
MTQQDVYRELSKKLMMEHSSILPKIWNSICSLEEAEIINALPATPEDLASRFAKPREEMQSLLEDLYHRGVVFDYVRDGVIYYRMPRHVIQFHDATILWEEAPQEMMDLWIEFGETDYPQLLELVTEIRMPSFMRVIPINETLATKNQVLAYEDALQLLENASTIAVTTCVCRKLLKKCENSIENCIQINKGAEYNLKRGTGRAIGIEEAKQILKDAQASGLVHLTENIGGNSNVICNCCTCCCEMLRFATDSRTKGVLAPSRYRATVNEEDCTACEACVDICPVGSISMSRGEVALVEAETCIGCGLCATLCPVAAISLIEVRPEEFIPMKG